MANVHVRVKELRLALGLAQVELATKSGVRRATISRLENARVTSIDMEVLDKLAQALGVEPGFLIARGPKGNMVKRGKR